MMTGRTHEYEDHHHHHLQMIVRGRLYKSVPSKFQQSCWRLWNGLVIPLSHSLILKARRSRIDENYDGNGPCQWFCPCLIYLSAAFSTVSPLDLLDSGTIWHRGKFDTGNCGGQFDTADNLTLRTIWHRTIWHHDILTPDNLTPWQFDSTDNLTPQVKTENLTPRTIWHQG